MYLKSNYFLLIGFFAATMSFVSSDPVEIGCKYKNLPTSYDDTLTYSCSIEDDFPYIFNITNQLVNKVNVDNHTGDKTDSSVDALQIVGKTIFQIPVLTAVFTNIAYIKIYQVPTLRYLVKENIGAYKTTLKHLDITGSGIEMIDVNIFEGMNFLETLDLQNNNIFYFKAETTLPLPFKRLYLKGNLCLGEDGSTPVENFEITTENPLSKVLTILKDSTCKISTALVLLDRYKATLVKLDLDSYTENKDLKSSLEQGISENEKLKGGYEAANQTIDTINGLLSSANSTIDTLTNTLYTTNLTAENCKKDLGLFEITIKQLKEEITKYQEMELDAERCLDVNGTCRFTNISTNGYTCIAHNIEIRAPGVAVNWTGTHISSSVKDIQVNTLLIKEIIVEYVPKNIGSTFRRLRNLIIQNCGLKKLSKDNFIDMILLENIIITSNNISSIDAGLFDDLYLLKSLDLSKNEIKILPAKIFVELSYLSIIKLDGNQLTTLRPDFLSSSNSVKYFSATNNKLAKVDVSFVWRMKGATFIDFSGNGCNAIFNQSAGNSYIDFYSHVLSKC